MRILIAPDKFKGSLSAHDVAANTAAGLRDVLPEATIELVPMADGGEGTGEVICDALGGHWVTCPAHDALGREIQARYAVAGDGRLAIIEMSEAAGLRHLAPNERDVTRASTFGVGEMILDAAEQGAKGIIVGLGGSATNDGGFGMARALGFRFFAGEKELTGAVTDLLKLTSIQSSAPSSRKGNGWPSLALARPSLPRSEKGEGSRSGIAEAEVATPAVYSLPFPNLVAAVDVKNPLLGPDGATRVFGPQKGARPAHIDILERALSHLADIVATEFGFDFRDKPGAGAAGGLGFGLMSFCRAEVRPGFDVVAEYVGLESKLKDVDFIVTGEGSLDRQTLEGKTAAGVARLARKFGKPVFAIVGRATDDRDVRNLFHAVYELARPGRSEAENIKRAPELLRKRAQELATVLKKTLVMPTKRTN
jgi:glycerate 2-kinase